MGSVLPFVCVCVCVCCVVCVCVCVCVYVCACVCAAEWTAYLRTLQEQTNVPAPDAAPVGLNLSSTQLNHFSDDQKQQLEKLRAETAKMQADADTAAAAAAAIINPATK